MDKFDCKCEYEEYDQLLNQQCKLFVFVSSGKAVHILNRFVLEKL